MFKKICIASDHAGYNLKETIKDYLINKHVSIFDIGPYQKKSVDYPDYAKKLAKRVKARKSDIGILVCGSGTGMAISANKIKDIGARLTTKSLSLKLVELFLRTKFDGGRHLKRINKI